MVGAAASELGDDVQFVGINIRDASTAQAQAFERNFDVDYPSFYDATARRCSPSPAARAAADPGDAVLDAEGRVAASIIGELPSRRRWSTCRGRRGRGPRWVSGSRSRPCPGRSLLAIPVALVAGLVSFFSPCVIPLLPGYLSYATGLSGADLGDRTPARADARRVGAVRARLLGRVRRSSGARPARSAPGWSRQQDESPWSSASDDPARAGLRRVAGPWCSATCASTGPGGRPRRRAAARLPVRAGLDALHRPDAGGHPAPVVNEGTAARGAPAERGLRARPGHPVHRGRPGLPPDARAFGWVRRHQVWVTRVGGADARRRGRAAGDRAGGTTWSSGCSSWSAFETPV